MRIIQTPYGQPNDYTCDCSDKDTPGEGSCGSCLVGPCYTICFAEEDGKAECKNCGTVYIQVGS
jgi:hypothetical protein